MHTYIAIRGADEFHGSWISCICWAIDRVSDRRANHAIKIARARPGERHMRVVAEITADGIQPISNGRLSRIRKADKRGRTKV